MTIDAIRWHETKEATKQQSDQAIWEQKIAKTLKFLESVQKRNTAVDMSDKSAQENMQDIDQQIAAITKEINKLKQTDFYQKQHHIELRIDQQKQWLAKVRNPRVRAKREQQIAKRKHLMMRSFEAKNKFEAAALRAKLQSLNDNLAILDSQKKDTQQALINNLNKRRSNDLLINDAQRDIERYRENLEALTAYNASFENTQAREDFADAINTDALESAEKNRLRQASIEWADGNYTITLDQTQDGEPVNIKVESIRKTRWSHKDTLVYYFYNNEGKFVKLPEIYPDHHKKISYEVTPGGKTYQIDLQWSDDNTQILSATYDSQPLFQ